MNKSLIGGLAMAIAATVLSPKAFGGSSIKSNVKPLEDFADERIAGK